MAFVRFSLETIYERDVYNYGGDDDDDDVGTDGCKSID